MPDPTPPPEQDEALAWAWRVALMEDFAGRDAQRQTQGIVAVATWLCLADKPTLSRTTVFRLLSSLLEDEELQKFTLYLDGADEKFASLKELLEEIVEPALKAVIDENEETDKDSGTSLH